jgi:hypothetical protein
VALGRPAIKSHSAFFRGKVLRKSCNRCAFEAKSRRRRTRAAAIDRDADKFWNQQAARHP